MRLLRHPPSPKSRRLQPVPTGTGLRRPPCRGRIGEPVPRTHRPVRTSLLLRRWAQRERQDDLTSLGGGHRPPAHAAGRGPGGRRDRPSIACRRSRERGGRRDRPPAVAAAREADRSADSGSLALLDRGRRAGGARDPARGRARGGGRLAPLRGPGGARVRLAAPLVPPQPPAGLPSGDPLRRRGRAAAAARADDPARRHSLPARLAQAALPLVHPDLQHRELRDFGSRRVGGGTGDRLPGIAQPRGRRRRVRRRHLRPHEPAAAAADALPRPRSDAAPDGPARRGGRDDRARSRADGRAARTLLEPQPPTRRARARAALPDPLHAARRAAARGGERDDRPPERVARGCPSRGYRAFDGRARSTVGDRRRARHVHGRPLAACRRVGDRDRAGARPLRAPSSTSSTRRRSCTTSARSASPTRCS